MHYIETRSILSPKNGMNLYRGCQHGCIYCDSRSRCYHMDHRFEDVAVKQNAIELLELALKRKRRPCMIGTGSMSDPYTPIEEELQMTRRALEVIERHGCGISILTKSDLILRDLDILERINRRSKAVVQMTLTTMDEGLCRLIEPGVCTTQKRVGRNTREEPYIHIADDEWTTYEAPRCTHKLHCVQDEAFGVY